MERPWYGARVELSLPLENLLYTIAEKIAERRGIKRLTYYAEFSVGGATTTLENYISASAPKRKLIPFRSLMKLLGDGGDCGVLSVHEIEDITYRWIERHAAESHDRVALRSALQRAQAAREAGDDRAYARLRREFARGVIEQYRNEQATPPPLRDA